MFQTLRHRSHSLSSTLMFVDIWKVFQTITLTHPYKSALVNIALNLSPGGRDGTDPQVLVPVTLLQPDVRGLLKDVQDYHSYSSQ